MIIQCDFDGTITRNNLSVLLRENFARGDWQKIELDYLHGRITVEQSNKLQYAVIKEPEEKLQEFVRQHIEVRPGFLQFVRYCRDNGSPLVIVSSGLDFYIKTVLAQIGMSDLELHCGQTSFSKDGVFGSFVAFGKAVLVIDPDGITKVPGIFVVSVYNPDLFIKIPHLIVYLVTEIFPDADMVLE